MEIIGTWTKRGISTTQVRRTLRIALRTRSVISAVIMSLGG
jgi:hypothetical protein